MVNSYGPFANTSWITLSNSTWRRLAADYAPDLLSGGLDDINESYELNPYELEALVENECQAALGTVSK